MKQTTTMSRRTFVGVAGGAAALAGLGLSGCGSDSAESGSSGSATLSAAVAYETKNYNPSTTSSALALGANWHVMEGLFELDMHDMKPYPALAKDDLVKKSDTEYTVVLRDDAKFSDGNAVKASDVVESWKRSTAPGNTYIPMLSFIQEISALDDKTIDIKLAYNMDPDLIKKRLSIIKVIPAGKTKEDLTKMPVGSGPWAYKSIDEKNIEFSVNDNYNGSKKATAKEMKWSIIKDDTARMTAINQGSVMVMENVPPASADEVKNSGATIDEVEGFSLPFLMFNTKKKPWDNNQTRQAIFWAIDTDKLIQNALAGKAKPATSFLQESHPNYHKASVVYTHNTDKAKQLLEASGAAGTKLTLVTTDHPWIKSLAPQIQNDLQAAGLSVEIKSVESSTLYSQYTDIDNPTYDIALAPGDPSVFGNDPDLLMNWWYGDNNWTKKRMRWADDPACTQLHDLMHKAVTSTGATQQDYWNQCYDLISEQVPLYPLMHRIMCTGYKSDQIKDFKGISTTGIDMLGASAK